MKKIKEYTPLPVDTSKIELSSELLMLAEEMAKNVHENWAQSRISEGWKFGTKRDDIKKEHPCIVEYDELPESEKEYDRNTSLETLKFLISKGYKITK